MNVLRLFLGVTYLRINLLLCLQRKTYTFDATDCHLFLYSVYYLHVQLQMFSLSNL